MAETAKNVVVSTELATQDKLGTRHVGFVRRITIDGNPFPYYTKGEARVYFEKNGEQVLWVPIFIKGDVVFDTSATRSQ